MNLSVLSRAILCSVVTANFSFADAGEGTPTATPTPAQFLPGEEVVTPSGKKMRIWNTAGPVPGGSAPTIQNQPNQNLGNTGLNVIVSPPNGPRPDRDGRR